MKFSKPQSGSSTRAAAVAKSLRHPTGPWTVFVPKTRVARFVENVRTGGKDPVYRRSLLTSFGLHAALILASLFPLWHTIKDFIPLPPGGGGGGATTPETRHVVHPPRLVKLIYRSNSPISFTYPTLDTDNSFTTILDRDSQDTYVVDKDRAFIDVIKFGNKSGPGQGPGTGPGRVNRPGIGPNTGPIGNGTARLLRLDTGDPTCNDGNEAHADVNLLTRLNSEMGIHKKPHVEMIGIAQLEDFSPGKGPPLVYVTGRGSIRVSDADVKILRQYANSGGMIFGDAGSPEFGQSFRNLIGRVFPGQPLCEIADDDPIFLMPHVLSNGAPSVFHHDGTRALGVRQNGRWVVFYHPGSLKDLWRDGGSHADPDIIQHSYDLGINVIVYAYSHYFASNIASNTAGHSRS